MGTQLSEKDRLSSEGEAFVKLRASEMGCPVLVGDGKLPSIDLQLQLIDPDTKTNLYLAVQIKTGVSYVLKQDDRSIVLHNLKPADILNWKSANVPVVLVWVDASINEKTAFWAEAREAKLTSGRLRLWRKSTFDRSAVSALVEIARTHAGRPSVPDLANPPISFANVRQVKAIARQYYLEWRRHGSESPVFGKVQVTRLAWRHITRVSLPQRAVVHRLTLLPCARQVIEHASESRFLRTVTDQRASRGGPQEELHAVRGIYHSGFRTDILVEVVIQVTKVNRRVVRSKLYSIQERRAW